MARPKTHDAKLRQALVAETRAQIERQGLSELNLRSLAHAAHTSTAAVYALFGSKQLLLEEVFALEIDDLVRRAGRDPITDTDSAKRFATDLRHWVLDHERVYTAIVSSGELTGMVEILREKVASEWEDPFTFQVLMLAVHGSLLFDFDEEQFERVIDSALRV